MKGLANVGDVLAGKYKVDKILGIGGMGMVVSAIHLELDQKVALKFMLPAAMESPEASARFLREARAAGRLNNEHICRVIDVGRFDSGAPYIVMEYMEGYDLGTMLKRRGPLRVGNAVDYILQACEGLAEAHAQGIIHRDLKPDNLFLTQRSDGVRIIKVLDFGISKAAVTGIATRTGDILGSPAYMAPEQMKSTKDVDARADVWSLGVVLYQLLAGKLPFTGDSLPTLCLSVLNDDPAALSTIREDLPEGLSEVAMRALMKEREQRYGDVAELAQALLPYASPDGIGSVTRVRQMLRRAEPEPSETFPLGFSAASVAMPNQGVAPTVGVHEPDSVDTPWPVALVEQPRRATTRDLNKPGSRPPLAIGSISRTSGVAPAAPATLQEERPVGTTTLGGSSGESLTAIPRTRFPLGLIGALCGAIAIVVVLIVMVLRSQTEHPAVQPSPPPPPPPAIEVIDASTLSVEPIPVDAADEAPAQEEVIDVDDGSASAPDRQRDKDPNRKGPRKKREKSKNGDGVIFDPFKDKDKATTVTPDAGVAAPPPAPDAAVDEDKWDHMHHDTPKLVPEPPPAPPSKKKP